MTLTAEWAGVFVGLLAIAVTIIGLLLNSIRSLLSAIRQDFKEVVERQNDTDMEVSTLKSRVSVIEEIIRRLKCGRCENGSI